MIGQTLCIFVLNPQVLRVKPSAVVGPIATHQRWYHRSSLIELIAPACECLDRPAASQVSVQVHAIPLGIRKQNVASSILIQVHEAKPVIAPLLIHDRRAVGQLKGPGLPDLLFPIPGIHRSTFDRAVHQLAQAIAIQVAKTHAAGGVRFAVGRRRCHDTGKWTATCSQRGMQSRIARE